LGEQIKKYVGDGARFGLKVDYSHDGDRLLGTGGALCKALPLLGEEFLVMYGDSYLPTPFRPAIEAFRTSERQGLMTVFRNDGRWDRSNVLFTDGEIRAYDKQSSNTDMQHIDFGLGLFQSAVFSKWSKQQVFGLEAVYQRLLAEGQLASYETTDRFFEIGSVEGIREATRYFNKMKEMNHAGASV
jgi:NDP-sugar pyrophosphorylase family protein